MNPEMEAFLAQMYGGDPEKIALAKQNLGYGESPMLAVNNKAGAGGDKLDVGYDFRPAEPPPPAPPLQLNFQAQDPELQKMLTAQPYQKPSFTNDQVGETLRTSMSGVRPLEGEALQKYLKGPEPKGPGGLDPEVAAAQKLAQQSGPQIPSYGFSYAGGPSASLLLKQQQTSDAARLANHDATIANAEPMYAEGRAAEAKANVYDTMAKVVETDWQQTKADEEKRQAAIIGHQQKIGELASALDGEKENPDKYWNEKSGGQKVSIALGFILGGIADGLGAKGTTDAISSFLQADIQRNIAAQRENFARKKDKLSAENNQHGIMLRDAAIATDTSNMLLKKRLESLNMELMKESERGNSAISKAKAEALIETNNAKIAELDAQLVAAAVRASYAAPGIVTKDGDRFVPTGPNGEGFMARTPAEAAKLRDGLTQSKEFAHALKSYKGDLNEVGWWDKALAKVGISTDKMSAAKSSYSELVFRAKGKSAADLGVLAGPDLDIIHNFVANPEQFFGNEQAMRNIDRILSFVEQQRASAGERYGEYKAQQVTDPRTGKAAYIPQGTGKTQGSLVPRKVNQ